MPLLSTFGAASARSFGGIGAVAAGAGLDVDEVFSTFVYDGSSSAQTINNGIDLSGEGGLVWIKERSSSGSDNHLTDTVRGIKNPLNSDSTAAENTYYANNNQGITAFNNNGFTVASGSNFNDNGDTAVSWTFRKALKFFDVVTYTGTGSAQNISHSLGSVPGMILVKKRNGTVSWNVFHRSLGATKVLFLNTTDSSITQSSRWNNTAPTSTQFTVGTAGGTNDSGDTYVAYLFAHNDGDGGFGPDGDQDIIKCGSFSTDSSGNATINLGFEPQFVMNKVYDAADNWTVADNMRGFNAIGDQRLYWNRTNAEATATTYRVTSTGFTVNSGETSKNFIYMAIRRGPLAAPEDATKVFALGTRGASTPGFTSNFPVDMFIRKYTNGSGYPDIGSRLTGAKAMQTSENFAEGNDSSSTFDHMNGYYNSSSADSNHFSWMWKRAPGYFDVVAYTSNTTYPNTFSHNLGVVPEMIWIKRRDSAANWAVYHSALGNTKHLSLNSSAAESASSYWNNTTPTASVVTVGGQDETWGYGNYNYIAYLFASSKVSKVGSYTGDGTSDRVIDCGFSNGARFVLIKDVDQSGTNWQVFDTARGLTSTKAELLRLNLTNAQIPNGSPTQDYHNLIEPDSSGFKINHTSALQVNASGVDYIFYAIA